MQTALNGVITLYGKLLKIRLPKKHLKNLAFCIGPIWAARGEPFYALGMIWRIEHHPRFKRLANYLASKAPPGRLPGRQHIDPLEIPDLLPHLMLIDVVPQESGPARYRIRLVGTEVVAIQGTDGTGRYVEKVLTAEQGRAEILRGYDEIVRTHQPEHRSGVVATHGREHVVYERIAFPLAEDGEHVNMLILVFMRIPK